MNPLITIVGPTAVGKTDLTLELAEQLHAEVISGDAYQVYKQLNIGPLLSKIPLEYIMPFSS